MKARTKRERMIVRRVTAIRSRNNRLWMTILTIALESSPIKAKKIIRQITDNDRKVSAWLSRV